MKAYMVWIGCLVSALAAAPAAPAPPDGAGPAQAQSPSAEAATAFRDALEQKRAKAWDKAIVLLERAVALTPGFVDAHNALAWCRVAKDDKARAADEFRLVIRLAPGTPLADEARAALDRWHVPVEIPPVPPTPTAPPTAPAAPPAAPPNAPPAPAAPVKPAAVDPNDPDVIWAPKADGPKPEDVRKLTTTELEQTYAALAAQRLKDHRAEVALAMYRHLLVLEPQNAGWLTAVDAIRNQIDERHEPMLAADRVYARETLERVRPSTDLNAWPAFDRLLFGAELRLLLDPRATGDGRYVVLRYPGCDPYVPVVLFTARPKLTLAELREVAGTPQVEARSWDQSVGLATWGHFRALVDRDGNVVALLRKMGDPTPETPARR